MEEPASEATKPKFDQLVHEDFDPNIKIKQEKNLTPPPTEPITDPFENEEDEKKPTEPVKSSKELLAELFSVFNAVPPEIILEGSDQGDSDLDKKSKKKKRHKEKKDKKHKKKKKSDHDEDSKVSKKRIKEEKHKDHRDKHSTERSIKIESVSGKQTKDGEDLTNIEITMSRTQRIQIKNLKNSLVLESRPHKDEARERHSHKHHRRTPDSDFSISDVEETVSHRSKSAERKQRHKQHEDFDRFYASYNDHNWQTKDQDGRSVGSGSRRHEVKKERPERREQSRDRREATRPRWEDRLHRDDWTRGRKRSRSRSRSGERIDKKRLLEIARKNAIHMLRNGSLPGSSGLAPEAKDKIIANLKCTGKSVQELTDYCKKISEGDLDDLSNLSGEDSDHDKDGNSRAFHHPFILKEREPIVMNIRNATVIPPKSAEQTKALSMQFPVSSGSAHKQKADEWIPVSPKRDQQVAILGKPGPSQGSKKKEAVAEVIPDMPSVGFRMEEADALAAKNNEVFPKVSDNLDVSQIISQRLNAMRKLQDNPTDTQAKIMLHSAQQDMSKWATAKFIPGQFLGSTGANPLSAKELAGGYGPGPWAKKDQLITSKPLSGGMGMNLLQKMGWRPGEGLGKDKTGQLQPLLLEVKLDKKGLVSNEEAAKPKRNAAPPRMTLEGKHPVSLLGELASKRRWGSPQYDVILESGPQHCKLFIFKVRLNGMEYQPSAGCNSKKEAKAMAAKFCLQQLGVLPT